MSSSGALAAKAPSPSPPNSLTSRTHCGYSRYKLNQGTEQWQHRRGGGLLSLVYTCGEMDLCPPCTEAHPPWRVGLPTRWVKGVPPSPTGWGGWILPTRWVSLGLTHRGGRKDPPHPVGELSDVDCTFTCIYVHILL